MAYTLFTEVHDGRQASVDYKFQRRYTRTFLVGTDNASYGAYYAASHSSVPRLYSAHPEDPYAFAVSVSPSQDLQDPTLWRIQVEYSYNVDSASGDPKTDTQQQGQDPADRVENPLLRPRDYTIGTNTRPWAVWKDIYGNPIQNTANDPFLPPIEIERVEATISVGLNSATKPTAGWLASVGYVNSNTVTVGGYVCAAGTLKLNKIGAQRSFENGISYWRWTLEYGYRATWAFELLNQGLREIGGKFIRDPATAEKVDQPALLDSLGYKLASGGTPVFLTYHAYPRIAFTTPVQE